MASQSEVHAYMERHRIRTIFEDLMNKILRDMPEEPLVYLLRAVYKKAGMEIPQGIRYGGLRKSTSELQKSTSPDRRSRLVTVSSSAEKLRTTSPSRVQKLKDGARSSKQKAEWNPDIKTKSSFDELWEESAAARKEKVVSKSSILRKSVGKQPVISVNAWASFGLGEDGEEYTSPAYQGQRHAQGHVSLSEKELLAMENVSLSRRSEPAPPSAPVISSGHFSHSRKMASVKHKQELGQLLSVTDHKLTDSGIGLDQLKDGDDDDDAIELLENGDDLRREGVKNIPKSGFKLSRNLRYRENEPVVKLNINAYVYPSENSRRVDTPETDRYSSATPLKMNNQTTKDDLDEEEEFESVSQVSGPRQPVWDVPDSDIITGDAIPLRPSYSANTPQKSNIQRKSYTEKSVHAATPVTFVDRSVDSAEKLAVTSKIWTTGEKIISFDNGDTAAQSSRSLQSLSSVGGWKLPEDTDVASGFDWNQRVKGGPARDPRAY